MSTRPLAARLRATLRAAWRITREIAGERAYEIYLEHHAEHHPGTPPMGEREFWRRHTDARDARPGERCC
ncbi:YbdD/YjiX family protein [Allonocardiopsis opalescens]|uniref:Uncharacterized short protein YbdD (DUF466 family) n=1 Tax=Allonocardiopsis opalescens TaxID=1144618 RepID=A0A2T0Q457_9ACTN|nr:YbdD/YjiX family protein [Allonocardiopsis opalescens]PRX98584.1 uncharacterized short protein YbdD (DUF466 family) [Allonocardiopsis opalescens]